MAKDRKSFGVLSSRPSSGI